MTYFGELKAGLNLVVDACHVELRLEHHQHDASDAEHQSVVGQSLAFGEQHPTSQQTASRINQSII